MAVRAKIIPFNSCITRLTGESAENAHTLVISGREPRGIPVRNHYGTIDQEKPRMNAKCHESTALHTESATNQSKSQMDTVEAQQLFPSTTHAGLVYLLLRIPPFPTNAFEWILGRLK
jgi:hypothetical protein